jgi:hypothetical protein
MRRLTHSHRAEVDVITPQYDLSQALESLVRGQNQCGELSLPEHSRRNVNIRSIAKRMDAFDLVIHHQSMNRKAPNGILQFTSASEHSVIVGII